MWAQLDAVAKQHGKSTAELVREIIDRYLKRQK
jgi:predicted DNA-binding protein